MTIAQLRARFVRLKNSNPALYLLWLKWLGVRGWLSMRLLDDREAIIRLYRRHSGRMPELQQPKRFSEKMQWLKLNFRDPVQTIVADKYAVRTWLAERGYAHLLNELIQVADKVDEVDFNKLPAQFVIKAAHASGWNLICEDKARFDQRVARKLMSEWLRQGIFWNGREWPYRDMPRRLVIESYLEDSSGSLRDYKFYCFNGDPKFIQANSGRGTTGHAQNFYSLGWELLPFGKDLAPRKDVVIPVPSRLEQMIEIARDLAKDFPYVRVDLYEVDGRVVFGEMTFFPASGMPDFIPDEADFMCGEMLHLPLVCLH